MEYDPCIGWCGQQFVECEMGDALFTRRHDDDALSERQIRIREGLHQPKHDRLAAFVSSSSVRGTLPSSSH